MDNLLEEKINKLIEEGNTSKALEICNTMPNDKLIQSLKTKIVMKQKEQSIKTTNIPNKQTKKRNNKSQLLIKDIFKDEVFQIQLYLYSEMNGTRRQKDAIKAWDIFEEMIIKPVTNKEALNKMVNFLKKMQKCNKFSIKLEEKRYEKYLNR